MFKIKKRWVYILLFFLLCPIINIFPFSQITVAQMVTCEAINFDLENETFVRIIAILQDEREHADFENAAGDGKSSAAAKISAEELISNLQETARSTEKEILPVIEEEIKKGNIKEYQYLWITNAFSAKINKEALKRLAELPQIIHIRPERSYTHSTPESNPPGNTKHSYNPAEQEENGEYPWNLELINAPSVWQEGIYGNDIVVAIMDTGVDLGHPALAERYRGNLNGHSHETSWYDVTKENPETNSGPVDLSGHGTHIAGVILGGTPEEPLGVAPGAHWIGVNIFDKGLAWDSHIAQAFQWLLAPGGDPQNAPDIINCSWASRPEYVTDYLQWQILHNLTRAGIFVVFAAGNNGQSGPGSPASYPHAFSVGAIENEGDIYQATDFSSKGPVKWQGIAYTKPEITAPGTNIRSSWINNSYNVLNGTSVAAAHVSGAAALLLQSRPEITPSEIGNILKESAYWNPHWNERGDRPNNVYGFGILDAYEAIKKPLSAEELLLFDGAEEGIANWSTSPENPWKTTREKVYEGSYALADSPWEKYENNSESWLMLMRPLKLCGYHSPLLSFQHFYDLQTGINKEDDYAYLEISTDGKNWGYLYRFSGTNEDYQHFSIPINLPSNADDLYIRFRLESNNNGPGRGWYIDNISISAVPLPLDRLILNPEKTLINIDEIVAVQAQAIFSSNISREVDPELIEWSSSNPSTAVVKKGRVKGISPGEALISGQFGEQRGEIRLKVMEDPDPAVEECATINGSIKLQGRNETDEKTTVSFVYNESGDTCDLSSLSADGSFSLKLPPGSYTIIAKRPQYLPVVQKIDLTTTGNTQQISIELKAGDIDSNNRIDLTDLTLLSLAYQSSDGDENFNPLADLNGDGVIDSSDLTTLIQNYGTKVDGDTSLWLNMSG